MLVHIEGYIEKDLKMAFAVMAVLMLCVSSVHSQSAECNIPCEKELTTTTAELKKDVPSDHAIVKPNTPISFSVKSDQKVTLYVQDVAGNDIYSVVIDAPNKEYEVTRVSGPCTRVYDATSLPIPTSTAEVTYWVWKNNNIYEFGLGCDPTKNKVFIEICPVVAENDVNKMQVQVEGTGGTADLCFMNMIAYLPTSNGERCLFPFFRASCSYVACTRHNHNQPWCYTVSGKGAWGNCVAINGEYSAAPITPVTTIAGCGPDPEKPCVFPFKRGCSEFSECTTVAYHRPWCFTENSWGCCP